jgi:hypothetical protein
VTKAAPESAVAEWAEPGLRLRWASNSRVVRVVALVATLSLSALRAAAADLFLSASMHGELFSQLLRECALNCSKQKATLRQQAQGAWMSLRS